MYLLLLKQYDYLTLTLSKYIVWTTAAVYTTKKLPLHSSNVEMVTLHSPLSKLLAQGFPGCV